MHPFPNDLDGISARLFSIHAIDSVINGEACITLCRSASALSSRPATFDRFDAIFAAHATVGILSQNAPACLCFNVGAIPSNARNFAFLDRK